MTEISNHATEQLRSAVLEQPVWDEVARGHAPTEEAGIIGYPSKYISITGNIPAGMLPNETQARLGYAEGPTDTVKISLGKRLGEIAGRKCLEETGEHALVVRLSRSGNPKDGSGKWMHLDYLLSPTVVSDQPEVPPVTQVQTQVFDHTEEMRLMYTSADGPFARLYEQAPVDPGTDEPDPELLINAMRPETTFNFLTDSAEAAEVAKTEDIVNQSMTELNAVHPLSDAEILALAGLVRDIEAERDF